ncbi:MAG: hypothetical protein LBU91_04500 [Bacteroidales bacterium]|jgi:hypothetical protein|nr:hypothetical protein [Bacteroidales bacterium]
MKTELTKKELKELVGGQANYQEVAAPDVINNNAYVDCICTYDNYSAVQNKNSVYGCSCECSG